MSMTKELAEQHLGDPAVFCCRRQKGLTISAADLEDPSIFSDMEEAGLLKLSPDGLTVAEVLGATLTQDVEALTPITKDVLDHVNAPPPTRPLRSLPSETTARSTSASMRPSISAVSPSTCRSRAARPR